MKPRAAKPGAKSGNGQRVDRIEDALSILIQNQAAFLARASETDRQLAELRQETRQELAQIHAILAEHGRTLAMLADLMQKLPDAVREKIGFSSGSP